MTMNRLWSFSSPDGDGTFDYPNADSRWRMYFPICNEHGMKNAVTPFFKGDVKTGQNSFLTVPVSVEDLHSCAWSRNFWVTPADGEPWSVTGVGPGYLAEGEVSATARGRIGSFAVQRVNHALGLEATVTLFCPFAEPSLAAEVMRVELRNVGTAPITLQPTYAVPVYARSADNLRSHRQLTSLLNRVTGLEHGFRFKPSMLFDEEGHHLNQKHYFVLGADETGGTPIGGWATLEAFVGSRHGLERPDAVFARQEAPPLGDVREACGEAVGALRFAERTLAPGAKADYTIVLAIDDRPDPPGLYELLAADAAPHALKRTHEAWKTRLDRVKLKTGDGHFDQWFRWVQFQPYLRRIYGCSFMPDHDYGRGGRGWRDLWQDMLGFLLTDPAVTREDMVRFFDGIRWDGSNATLIGEQRGTFFADRDGISRVWSDHGVWPWLTLKIYIDQTGDSSILLEPAVYWKDRQTHRAQRVDPSWTPEEGCQQKDARDGVVEGSVLEHILLQHYVAFFHVGEHDLLRLESADWNDGIDMARTRGETVHFTGMYAGNLLTLADTLEHMADAGKLRDVELHTELVTLMALGNRDLDRGPRGKQEHLEAFFDAVTPRLSGECSKVPVAELVADMRARAGSVFALIREQEWISVPGGASFYNAYYDESGRRVDGPHPTQGTQMNLAAQAMLLLAGLAQPDQVDAMVAAVQRHLGGSITGLPALCTDVGGPYMELGRNFGYAYGNKENGSPFSHMNVMYAAGLLTNGACHEGWDVLRGLYESSTHARGEMLPGIPEYFEPSGRGVYCYLTGAAAWYVMTLLARVVGVRGRYGDLVLQPRFAACGIDASAWSLRIPFAERELMLRFHGKGGAVAKVEIAGAWVPTVPMACEAEGVTIARTIIADCAVVDPLPVDVYLTEGR